LRNGSIANISLLQQKRKYEATSKLSSLTLICLHSNLLLHTVRMAMQNLAFPI